MQRPLMVGAVALCFTLSPTPLLSQSESLPASAKTVEITANGPFEVLDGKVSGVRLVGLDEDAVRKLVLHKEILRISIVHCTLTDTLCDVVAKTLPKTLSVQHCRSTKRQHLLTMMSLSSLHELGIVGGQNLAIADSNDPLVIGSDVRVFRCTAVHGELFDLVRDALSKCSLLDELELSDVGMASGNPVLLSMKGISKLILSGNLGVTDRYLIDQVCQVTTLEVLRADRCSRLTASGLTHLTKLKRLAQLSIGALSFDSEVVASLSKLPSLRSIDVSGATASASVLRQVFALPSLASVTAIGTSVDDDVILESKVDIARLEFISLAWCEDISDVGARVLASNMKLKTLDLSGCPKISKDGRSALKWLFAGREILLDN